MEQRIPFRTLKRILPLEIHGSAVRASRWCRGAGNHCIGTMEGLPLDSTAVIGARSSLPLENFHPQPPWLAGGLKGSAALEETSGPLLHGKPLGSKGSTGVWSHGCSQESEAGPRRDLVL